METGDLDKRIQAIEKRQSRSRIWLSSPHMGGSEKEFIEEAFNTNWISPIGPNINGFESDISEYLGGNTHVAALSSGTAAIHLGLILMGVQSGDEVLCQSLTFSASANPILYLGAKPIFIDSEMDTWNMDPLALEHAIQSRIKTGKKPRAIVVVHLYGMPANIKEIESISKTYEIPILEDAAEALGSSIDLRKCGTFGDLAILSFNGNKIITTSAGGALISKRKEWVEKARFLATQARDPAPHYEHSEIGYNYRMSNICAGIGRGQMKVLEQRVSKRRENFNFYKEHLSKFQEFLFQTEKPGSYSNRWLTTVLIHPSGPGFRNNREKIRLDLLKEDIECRPLWKPLHLQPVFAGCPYYGGGVSESLFQLGLCLPSGSNLSNQDLCKVIETIESAMSIL